MDREWSERVLQLRLDLVWKDERRLAGLVVRVVLEVVGREPGVQEQAWRVEVERRA